MAGELAALINLGIRSAEMLEAAGITNEKQLREPGAVEAYLSVKQVQDSVSLNLLYAIEGALMDVHWNAIGRERRESLLMEVDARLSQAD